MSLPDPDSQPTVVGQIVVYAEGEVIPGPDPAEAAAREAAANDPGEDDSGDG